MIKDPKNQTWRYNLENAISGQHRYKLTIVSPLRHRSPFVTYDSKCPYTSVDEYGFTVCHFKI